MNTPRALQPSAANDALRLPRCVVFQTIDGAQHAAKKLACNASPHGTCQIDMGASPFGIYSATDAAERYEVTLDTIGGDYLVKPLTAAEFARKQQAAWRAQRDELRETAAHWDMCAFKTRFGSVRAEYRRLAKEQRAKARELEAKLVVSGVTR